MKKQVLFLMIALFLGCLLMLSCDKEQFTDVGTDLIQVKEELSNNEEASLTAPIVVDEVLAPKNEHATAGIPTRPIKPEIKWTIDEVLYSNSFETDEEYGDVFVAGGGEVVSLIEWSNDMSRMGHGFISMEVPESGGMRSLMIEGVGCVIYDGPFSIFTKVGPFSEDKEVMVRFWAYDVGGGRSPGSGVQMKVADDTDRYFPGIADLSVGILNDKWELHETNEVLHIPAGKVLYVHPYAASGIAGSTTIYVDLLEVIGLVAS